MKNFGNSFEKGPERSLEKFPAQDGRLSEDQAFLAQKIATGKQGIQFNEQSNEKSMDFASELIGELLADDLSLEGLDWGLVRATKEPAQVISLLREYAKSRGVEDSIVDEYLKDTKDEPMDFSSVKKLATLISFLVVMGVGGVPSQGHAGQMAGNQFVREYSKLEMSSMKDVEAYNRGLGLGEIEEYQERYKDYFNKVKSENPEIRDIHIHQILLSQKILEETKGSISFAGMLKSEYYLAEPAVVAEVELEMTTKDGRKTILSDKSFKNINPKGSISIHPLRILVDYSIKKGWVSPSLITRSDGGGWREDWSKKFQGKLVDESIRRIGDQIIPTYSEHSDAIGVEGRKK